MDMSARKGFQSLSWFWLASVEMIPKFSGASFARASGPPARPMTVVAASSRGRQELRMEVLLRERWIHSPTAIASGALLGKLRVLARLAPGLL
ncbi:hypothetical protein D9M70_628220 [compost metagenome]